MKRLMILLCVLLPLGAMAQSSKIAYVNSQEVLMAMPELTSYKSEMSKVEADYKKELSQMQDEFKKKYTDYIAQRDSLTQNIRLRREQEIQDIQQRINNFMQVAQQDSQKKASELMKPIQDKVRDAIQAVGKEKGYTVIITPEALLYTGSDAVDATPFVKAKLGLN